MTWNHRVVKVMEYGEPLYLMCEVFYDEGGKPQGYSEPSTVSESIEGLQLILTRMSQALTLPVLDAETDFKEA